MGWKIELSATASQQLGRVDKSQSCRILAFLRERVSSLEDPRSLGKALKGPLGDFWCYRVGDFRILCDLDDKRLCVLVVRLGHRREVYRR